MSLRNALGLFFLGIVVAGSADLWYVKPREHVVLAATQFLVGIALAVWGAWKAPKFWKPRVASPKSHDNVAA